MKLRLALAVFLIVVFAPLAGAGSHSESAARWSGTVSHVTDGDTLWVRPRQGGAARKVRLDGIDAPEICQAHGPAARDALAAQVQGQAVTVAASGHDDYGRTLARLRVRGRDVGGWMVAHGHAWSYRYRRNAGPYARQQRQAQAAQLGLFVDPGAQEPRDFRQQHGTCH